MKTWLIVAEIGENKPKNGETSLIKWIDRNLTWMSVKKLHILQADLSSV